MTAHLRVLVVEDVEDDLLLTLRALRRGGYTLDYLRVETPEEMQSALDHQDWHLVIADYTLPKFSAIAALKLLQAHQQDLPFIIVSGTIGEETAVAAMKAGAHDYILKGNLARLVPAVERELREAEERQKRQQAEQALRESEAALRQSQHQYQSLAETSPVGIFRTDTQGNYVYVNRQWCDMTGLTFEQARQTESLTHALHPDDRDHVVQAWQAALKKGLPFRLEYRFQRPNGTITWVFGQAVPERSNDADVLGYVGTITDISDRKFAQHQVREQAALLDVTTDAILVRGMNGIISFWNKGAETLYGWSAEEALGQDADQLLYADEPDDEEIYQSLMREGSWKGERKQVTQTGQAITVMSRWTLVTDEQGQPNAILTVNTDITQAKQLESRFLRAQRLESIGILASGIAHDLNNILTPIYGVADLLPLQLPDVDEVIQNEFEILKNSAKRGSQIINQMLLFAKGVEGDRSLLSIRYLIKEIRSFVHNTFPKSIEIAVDLPKNIDSVKGDETQLHQVFMNLFVNARDAMPDGGKLTISAMNLQLDRAFVSSHLNVEAGPYVVVTVADTGTGIPSDKLAYIFDPFFSTKQAHGGTGLGLSTVHGIIQSHGGFITVDTEVGQGTQFRVYLPAIEAEEIVEAEVLSFPLSKGDGVLVVDDEAPIREIAQRILESHNYKVIVATDGIDAIAQYTKHQSDIKVVLMDMTMPSLGGAKAIQVMQRINPEVKVIAVSGLPSNEKIALSLGENVKAFLPKPYNATDLLSTIPTVLQPDSTVG
ncbi:hybrid sensor histidine kinase/response regulator [Leptothoe sp. PORK10 BA2]|uniref:hybrid sensor histidine kinase/response regulator n=1 Tax=Leptothoe sp. PORK10 BA2 TaxID=3110254 RepID=UPI002B21EC90|nr:PAS domain S-box protein [Leptothoe sp. PORK10 BA2]MEA5463736.1 PAS domain S-box protein [Leptothoe sp. PORK10 BA2]